MTTSIIGSMEFSCKQSTLHHLQLRKGAMGRSSSGAAVGVAEGGKTGQGMRATNPISPSKGITIAVVVGCAIAVVTTALLPSTELSITDSCQIDGPIQKLKSAVQGHRYWVKQLQLLDEEVRYLEA